MEISWFGAFKSRCVGTDHLNSSWFPWTHLPLNFDTDILQSWSFHPALPPKSILVSPEVCALCFDPSNSPSSPLLLTPSCNTVHLPGASCAPTGNTPSRPLHLLCSGCPFHPCPTLGTRPGSCPTWVPTRPTATTEPGIWQRWG